MSLASLRAFTEDRPLVWLLAIGLGIRLFLLWATADHPATIVDERQYLTIAGNIAAGNGFASEYGPTSMRPPLYPWIVALAWSATGTRSLALIRAIQTTLGLVTIAIVWRLGEEVFDRRVARTAALIVWLYPSLILYSLLALTETLFTLLVAASLLSAAILLRTVTVRAAAMTGVLIGLGALTRSVLWPYSAVLAVLVGTCGAAGWRRRWGAAAVLIAAQAMVLTPWAVRNSRLQGVPVIVDTMGGLNLHMGNYEYTPHDRPWDAVSLSGPRNWAAELPASPPQGGPWTEGLKERWARERAIAFMKANPVLTLGRAAIKFGDFWALEREFVAGVQQGVFGEPNRLTTVAAMLSVAAYPLLLFAAVAGVVIRPWRNWPAHLLLLGTAGFVCALHAVTFGHPRYRLPLTPILALYAGSVLVHGAGGSRNRRAWLVVCMVCGIFGAIWAAQAFTRDWIHVQRLLAGAVFSQ